MTVGPSTAVPLTRAVCCLRVPLIAELRRRGVVCSAVRGGQHWFEVPGQTRDLSAEEVASLLKLRKRGWFAEGVEPGRGKVIRLGCGIPAQAAQVGVIR